MQQVLAMLAFRLFQFLESYFSFCEFHATTIICLTRVGQKEFVEKFSGLGINFHSCIRKL